MPVEKIFYFAALIYPTLMKKVSLVFSDRDLMWRFLNDAHGTNLSIHHRIHCITAEFSIAEIETGKEKFGAQVFEGLYTGTSAPPTNEIAVEKQRRFNLPGAMLL